MNAPRPQIYFCHANAQQSALLSLRDILVGCGMDVFIDVKPDASAPGSDEPEELSNKVDSSDVMLVFWSAQASRSLWVWWELKRFQEKHPDRPCIPFMLDETPLPSELARRQAIDGYVVFRLLHERFTELSLREPPQEEIHQTLCKEARQRAEHLGVHSHLLATFDRCVKNTDETKDNTEDKQANEGFFSLQRIAILFIVAITMPVVCTALAGLDDMVEVPAGRFFARQRDGRSTQRYSEVYLPGFYIDKTEVTVADYRQCIDEGACPRSGYRTSNDDEDERCNLGRRGRDQHPINCVTWKGAEAYCRWAGKRLPNEDEWEKAASGVDRRRFPWGDDSVDCRFAVFKSSNGKGCGRSSTWPVGSKPPGESPFGALDMAGNVWEWTAEKVLRGGAWSDDADAVDLDARIGGPSATRRRRLAQIGFRCAQNN